MLIKFSVENFKNFKEKIELDFTQINNYTFNEECIKNNKINKALIYGKNGSGKSNFGFAIFDIINHLTDKQKEEKYYSHYSNAYNQSKEVNFSYLFDFDGVRIEYNYKKINFEFLIFEELKIDDKVVVSHDRRESKIAHIELEFAENLNKEISNEKLSTLKYIKNNTNYKPESTIGKFFEYVDNMLWIRAVRNNKYLGYKTGSYTLTDFVIKNNLENEFEEFLNRAGVECNITTIEETGKNTLAFDFGQEKIPFLDIASSGTAVLLLFFCWLKQLEKVSLLFIDEFDAYFHQELAEKIIEILKNEYEGQLLITTHCSGLMNNQLLRPDCYFIIKNNKINPLYKLTEKELREENNLEKMYRAGAFE